MNIDWQTVIPLFSGKFAHTPSHLAPSVIFEQEQQQNPYICPLTNIGFLSVQGIDAKKFLQGQLTCDLNEINEKKIGLSGRCTTKGRLEGIFYVIQFDAERYYLAMPAVQLNIMQTSLKKYAIFSKVKIEVAVLFAFGLLGQKADIAKINPTLNDLKLYDKQDLNNASYISIPTHDENVSRWLVLLSPSSITETEISAYWQSMRQLDFKNMDSIDWHKLNILALLPTVYPETNEKCLPHTLNLPKLGAVSFKKGCYLGQEIVARMEYLGNLKKTICCREFQWSTSTHSALPQLGEPLPQDKPDHILLDFVPLPNTKNTTFLGMFVTDY